MDDNKSFCAPHELATLFVILIAIELIAGILPMPTYADIATFARAHPDLSEWLPVDAPDSPTYVNELTTLFGIYFTIVIRMAQFAACFIYLVAIRRKSSAALGLDFTGGLRSTRIGLIASGVMGTLVFASAGLFFLFSGKNLFSYLGDGAGGSALSMVAILVPTALVGPIIEEVLFRAILYGSLRRMTGVRQGIVISALIFSGLHLTGYSGDPTGMIMIFTKTFAGGVIFACVYEKCGNIIGPAIVHGLGNAALFLLPKLL